MPCHLEREMQNKVSREVFFSSPIRPYFVPRKCPLFSPKIVNWPSWITLFRAHILVKQNGRFPRGQYERSVWSMSCSASDLKSEEKLDEKREPLIHKRKMLGLEVVNK